MNNNQLRNLISTSAQYNVIPICDDIIVRLKNDTLQIGRVLIPMDSISSIQQRHKCIKIRYDYHTYTLKFIKPDTSAEIINVLLKNLASK